MQLFHKILSGMVNNVDHDQTSGAVWSGFALFACAILSETLVYEILGYLPYTFLCILFTGQDCQADVDECLDPSTCLNGADCKNTEGSFECNCTTGYEGEHCQLPNCSQVPCEYSSTCMVINAGANWKCHCLSEFYEGELVFNLLAMFQIRVSRNCICKRNG